MKKMTEEQKAYDEAVNTYNEARKALRICRESYYMPNLRYMFMFVYVDPCVGSTCSGIAAFYKEEGLRRVILDRCPDAMFLTIVPLAKEFPDEDYMRIYDNLSNFENGVETVKRIRKMKKAQAKKSRPSGGEE